MEKFELRLYKFLHQMGKQPGSQLPLCGMGGGNGTAVLETEKGRSSRLNYTCATCLWNWKNLHGSTGRVCYHNTSPRYHQRVTNGTKSCTAYETRVYYAKEDEKDE